MDDMKDTTKKMENTTSKMGRSTEHLKDRTEDLFKGAREIIAITNQNLTFEDVIAKGGVSDKLLTASIFFASMEFQHWQGDYEDVPAVRDELMAKAVKYFFWKIDDFINDDYDINTPFIPQSIPFLGESYNRWLNLSVFAVAMSKVHESQVDIAFQRAVPVYSMYDIIKEGLAAKDKYETGEELPEYIAEVLRYESKAKYLLQLRHNFYPIILASKLSNIEDSTWQALKHKYLTWEVDPGAFNKAQYEMFDEILAKGFETRQFLESANVELKVNETVSEIYKNLMWVITDNKPYQRLIEQLGVNPNFEQVLRYQVKLNFQPKVESEAEKLIVLLNEYTGSTLFVYNREGAKKALEAEQVRQENIRKTKAKKNRETRNKRLREWLSKWGDEF